MRFNPVTTELTTAATDIVLGLLALGCAAYLWQLRDHDPWKVTVWCTVFAALAVAALLGAVVHGMVLSASQRNLLWQPIYLSLGVAVSLFLVGAVYDWKGPDLARSALPATIALAVLFFLVTRFVSGSFAVFVVFEAMAMVLALGMYGVLAFSQGTPGMRLMLLGVGLNIVAAAIQATRTVSFRLFWPFDHNGAFHLVQMVAIVVICVGLRGALTSGNQAS